MHIVPFKCLAHLNLTKSLLISQIIESCSKEVMTCPYMSYDVCRLGHWRFLSQVLLSLPPFLSLEQIVPQKSKDSRSFQNLNQQLQMTQMMEPFNQLPIETKTTCQSLHIVYVISIHFICLSVGLNFQLFRFWFCDFFILCLLFIWFLSFDIIIHILLLLVDYSLKHSVPVQPEHR